MVESIGHAAPVGVVAAVAALGGPDAVHHVEALEGVLAVEEPALVHLAQVALDVHAGEGGAAEQHRDLGQAAGVQLLEVLAHDQRALHEQAAHADGVGLHLDGLVDHLADVHLDAEVVHLVAVVGEDDVDEVLADVVDVALHRGQHDAALGGLALDLVHHRLEVGDGRLHRLGRLQHERQLHLALAEEVADDLHPREEDVVDDRAAGRARRPGRRRGRR